MRFLIGIQKEIINYRSKLPRNYSINVMKNMMNKVLETSDDEYHEQT